MGTFLISTLIYCRLSMRCLTIIALNLEMIWIALLTIMDLHVWSWILVSGYCCICKISIINGLIINGCSSLNIMDEEQSIISKANPI